MAVRNFRSFNIDDIEREISTFLKVNMETSFISNVGMRTTIFKSESKARNYLKSAVVEYSNAPKACFQKAIEYLTKSIAYAPVTSEVLPLSFANRAAILMKAGHYEDALIDIERSLNTGYPEILRPKLLIRRALCCLGLNPEAKEEAEKDRKEAEEAWNKMKSRDHGYDTIKTMLDEYSDLVESLGESRGKCDLTHEPEMTDKNREIVGASGAIQIEYTQDKGQFITATRNIEPGEFFYISEPYVAALTNDRRLSNCWHCFKQTWIGTPCRNCSNIIYCSTECKTNSWYEYHEFECKILCAAMELDLELADILGVRLLIKALKNVETFENLKRQFEEFESYEGDPRKRGFTGDVYDSTSDNSINSIETMKGALLRTFNFSDSLKLHLIRVITVLATKTEFLGTKLAVSEVKNHENTALAAALLWKYCRIADLNLFHNHDCSDSNRPVDRNGTIIPIFSLFTRGCWSNISATTFGKRTGFFARYPVKKGEELVMCSSYQYCMESFQKREKISILRYGQPCKCKACIKRWPLLCEVESYNDRRLKFEIRVMLSDAVSQCKIYWEIAKRGNVKECKEIIGEVANYIKSFDKHVAQPCKEIIDLSSLITLLCCRLGTIYIRLSQHEDYGVSSNFGPHFDDDILDIY